MSPLAARVDGSACDVEYSQTSSPELSNASSALGSLGLADFQVIRVPGMSKVVSCVSAIRGSPKVDSQR